MTAPLGDILHRAHSELEQRMQMLERSNAALEHFACDASHDLGEPLRVMSLLAERLVTTSDALLDEEGRRLLMGIVDGLDRMRTLLNDLLEYSRVSGEPRERKPVDCGYLLEATLELLEDSIAEKAATVTHGVMPVVDAHPCQLGQVLQNLVSNALKFSREDSPLRIHIAARRQRGEWLFSVEDNGIGMDPSQAERAFELFGRLHPCDAYAGTGIGLSICKRIVAHHGGRIWVERAPGGGSIFRFTIPDQHVNNESQPCRSLNPFELAVGTA